MKEEKKKVSIDVAEFVRTRDALTSAYLSLSASLDSAVKAYIAHTEVVLKGDASLDVSGLLKPFDNIAAPQLAQLALAYQQNGGNAQTPAPEVNGKRKRTYKPRDPNAPKRPLTAYFRFLQETRGPLAEQMAKTEGQTKPGDLTKMATERWRGMSTEDQAPYKEAYQRALKDYEAEVAKYKASGVDVPEEAAEDEDEEPEIEAAPKKAKEESTASESSASEEDSEEEEARPAMPPPPPPKAPSPEVKKTPKSSRKKKDKAEEVIPTPQFSSINPNVPVSASKSASPELKRKAPAESAEDGGKKKRGRKTKAEKEAIDAAAAKAAAEAAAPASDASADKKKEKKKKRKSEA